MRFGGRTFYLSLGYDFAEHADFFAPLFVVVVVVVFGVAGGGHAAGLNAWSCSTVRPNGRVSIVPIMKLPGSNQPNRRE